MYVCVSVCSHRWNSAEGDKLPVVNVKQLRLVVWLLHRSNSARRGRQMLKRSGYHYLTPFVCLFFFLPLRLPPSLLSASSLDVFTIFFLAVLMANSYLTLATAWKQTERERVGITSGCQSIKNNSFHFLKSRLLHFLSPLILGEWSIQILTDYKNR